MSYPRNYRKKRNSNGAVVAVIVVLVLAAIALGGAYLWQNATDPDKTPASQASEKEEDDEPEESSLSASDESSGEQDNLPDGSSQASPFEDLDTVVVPKGDWVPSEYFDDALFVGDSITYGMSIYKTMTNSTVIAHTGINPETILTKAVIQEGDQTLTVLDAMKLHDAAKIYVMLGANGVAFLSEETMMEYYDEFLQAIQEQHPDSIIYAQSILPVTAEKSKDENYSNTRIDSYNLALMNLCKTRGVYYLNVAEVFKDETGALPDEASPKDGMHFGPTYYTKWFDYLKCHAVE